MDKKTISGIVVTLLLVGMVTLTFNVQRVEASETVYIRADGSVEGTTHISSVDNITYTFTGNIYDEIVVERDNIVVDGEGYTLQGTGNGTGIHLLERSNVTIKNTEIKAFGDGILLKDSANNTISGNTLISNTNYGIYIVHSPNNSISGNNIANNYVGIVIPLTIPWSPSNNIIAGNVITKNTIAGIVFNASFNSTVSGNSITANNGDGIFLAWSLNNSITGNDITNNDRGITLYESSNNTIYHNDFVDNIVQVFMYQALANAWDYGYPSGGNYWSDYSGPDSYHGPYQNLTGSDGIGDTAYVINGNNIDRYPLVPLFCDLNDDGKVNISDVLAAAIAFGSHSGHPRWNPAADINGDSQVRVDDMLMIALNFGKTW